MKEKLLHEPPALSREERRAAALRANLRRRKAQQAARQEKAEASPAAPIQTEDHVCP